jgi:hypothetical protein
MAKSMQARSRAVKNAVVKYNAAASALSPPRSMLDWDKVSKWNVIEEFALLRDTRSDLVGARWSDPEVRETMKLYQRVKRAYEEITRANIEIRRLYTSIIDEHQHFSDVECNLQETGQRELHGAVREFCERRRKINRGLLGTIQSTQSLPGYSGGTDLLGTRLGEGRDRMAQDQPAESQTHDNNDGSDDDEVHVQLIGLADYMSELHA